MRYERKFVVDSLSKYQVESLVLVHKALFRPIHLPRQINNIYFDTHNFTFYSDNVIGKSSRKKVRIRWYGETFALTQKPVLEYKLKTGAVGSKLSFKLKPFNPAEKITAESLRNLIAESEVPEWVKEEFNYLEPKLINSYTRKYFLTDNTLFRLTLDSNLTYINIGKYGVSFNEKQTDNHSLVVELKYDIDADEQASEIGVGFAFRLSKSSKYVNGIDCFNKYLTV